MEVVVIEVVLWAGLIFFFWVLKDSLGRVESDIKAMAIARSHQAQRTGLSDAYVRPEKMLDPIGTYKDQKIYRYAIIDGKNYQFDHVLPSGTPAVIGAEERCIAPGLVYTACRDQRG